MTYLDFKYNPEHGGHILVDLDKTTAEYLSGDYKGKGDTVIGKPIMPMILRIREWIRQGWEVKIFTARADAGEEVINAIQDWTEEHIGKRLEVTNIKTRDAYALIDDRAIGVIPNTGKLIEFQPFMAMSDAANQLCEKYQITHQTITRLLEAAAEAEEIEQTQLDYNYSSQDEWAYGFLRLLRGD